MKSLNWRDARLENPSAIALGNFDGVHLGHRHILDALCARATKEGLKPVALTFEPHPRQFLFPDAKTSLLTSPREKTALLESLGIHVVTLAFDADLASLTAEEFASDVLMNRLRGKCFFLGADHRFGKGARGNATMLHRLVEETTGRKDSVIEVAPVYDNGELVSSSAIRHHLKNGELARANTLLDRPYSLHGTIITGSARGRTLGFPTANLHPEDSRKILPFGVFGGYATLEDGSRHSAVANLGLRPTFHEAPPEPSVEIHLLDWSGALYDQLLTFEFHHFLRGEKKFDGLESLKAQIAEDVRTWRAQAVGGSR